MRVDACESQFVGVRERFVEKWASHHCQRFVRFVPCTFQPTVVHQRKGIQLHEATIWRDVARASGTYPLCLFAWWSYLFGNQTWVAFLCLFNGYICLFAAFLCRLLHILLPTLLLEVTLRSHKNLDMMFNFDLFPLRLAIPFENIWGSEWLEPEFYLEEGEDSENWISSLHPFTNMSRFSHSRSDIWR